MKKFLIALNILIWTVVCVEFSYAEGVTQKVCHEKNGKQVCKITKVHKKITDVTAVPTKKK
jgi:hypothetical protein